MLAMNNNHAVILAMLAMEGTGAISVNRVIRGAAQLDIELDELIATPASDLAGAWPEWEAAAGLLDRVSRGAVDRAKKAMAAARDKGAFTLSILDGEYPKRLRRAMDDSAPPLLFCYGNPELLDGECAGVVGAREVSEYGREIARDCTQLLVEDGAVVVSGGARGVDETAHETALTCGGSTIVVIPQGILSYRLPPSLAGIAEKDNVLVASEFLPRAGWTTAGAVMRNRTISALSHLVCVVEPRKQGGSIRTARAALEQRKPVLVYLPRDDRSGLLPGVERLTTEDGALRRDRCLDCWRQARTESGPDQLAFA